MAFEAVVIAAQTLACRRGERVLFESLSFDAQAGTLTEIVGANGSGKTSLLRILAGLMTPSAGTVRVTRPGGGDEAASSMLHYAGHADALKTQMTARDNLAFAAAYFGAVAPVDDALERLGLARQADLPVGYFSAGQRRRLVLARCWMLQRPLWLLDEPTGSLDAAGRALVGALIAEHVAAGGAVVAATHDALGPAATRVAIG